MSYTTKGRVYNIGYVQQVSDSFKKRDIVLEYADNPNFPELVSFQSTQDKVSLFDNLSVGDEVEISWNLRGREWVNKEGVKVFFNTLQAWRVQKLAEGSVATPTPANNIAEQAANEPEDDLPF